MKEPIREKLGAEKRKKELRIHGSWREGGKLARPERETLRGSPRR